uniref:Uncharacterized protein n=1 Tax=viral metagenome TaxID=1070528 RepID=A0A6C0CG01_9ZZZZ
MELSERHLLILVVLIVLVIIVAVLIFNNQYKTQAERDANHYKLVWGILIGIVASVLIVFLLTGGSDEKEYGIWTSIKKYARNKKEDLSESYNNARERSALNRAGRRAGESMEERDAKISELKVKQNAAKQERLTTRRDIKNAGKNAEAEAARAARAGGKKAAKP